MSTITKEWLQQKIADMETARDDIPFGLSDDGDKTLAALRIALTSLEAEPVAYILDGFKADGVHFCGGIITAEEHERTKPALSDRYNWKHQPLYIAPPAQVTINAEPVAWLWSHRKHPSEVTLVRPEDDERAEGAHWSGWSCQALYAAPPATASVPKDIPDSVFEVLCQASGGGGKACDFADELWNACRAAMLQGAEPVTTDTVQGIDMRDADRFEVERLQEIISGSRLVATESKLLARFMLDAKQVLAAPQQEVKP
ncbi:hypothetical protein L8T13_07550 [Enterobacter roggenkampii]|uniref:hypothetical protein n=1 Tax=Enterobacter roggenkampii TaxID=1812935 RepID=UPI0020034FF3|nr:hypothetical protein [Enterobacter roggenkampii]MCK6949277.1 hypothetical protein [Enterobacter roggenkampii]